ncbi:response regulator [Pedosphaera parvula]|uniref:Response regulator receiver protein n=1 Tax=Pedosphaera parvula (strain Ellin514) TaxID=320771 RepID=B9XIY4_PEDPL|nr:response regulator [Pedosphaera parvula]EEF60211.1 response regulator receiver protein [Pedosphaera parvula Ellin514]
MTWKVLIAEDCENDLKLLVRAFSTSDQLTVVYTVPSGDEAARYLSGQGAYADRATYPFPNLLVTDLKMPGFDGLDLLEWLIDNPFPHLVVMMLTGSTLQHHADATEKLGADAFFNKPNCQEELMNLIQTIEDLMAASPKAAVESRAA